ncbi:MAG: transporter, partial [Comamonadaceae bacterium]
MTRLKLSAVLIGLAALGGCVNLAPTYEQPRAPVPQRFPSAQAVSGANGAAAGAAAVTNAAETGWREFFVDERLRQTIALALANNRDLRIAALNIERARSLYGIARASAYPGVDAGFSASRSRSASTGNTTSQYTADLGLVSYELDFFGRVRNLGEAALQDFFSLSQTRRSAQISLVAEVATAWITLSGDLQRLRLARDTLSSQQRSFDLVSRAHAL